MTTRELASDLRLHVFAVLLAVGTIHHELEFVLEQTQVSPLTEYMERWSRAVPSIGWPSEVGLSLHAANVALALLLLWRRRSRELLCLLAVTFPLSQLATPNRISSHSGLMVGGLLVILLMAIGEWREGAGGRGDAWYHSTLRGLSWICALTYCFAFLYKLNPVWLSPRTSAAPAFLLRPVTPLLSLLGLAPAVRPTLEAVAIHGTLLIELLLPVLLFVPATRVLGCLIGLVFHIPMVAQGVADFPVVIVAFYPAFLSLTEARELVQRALRPPRGMRLAGSAVLGGYGILVIQRAAPALSELYGGAWLHPLVHIGHNVLTCATLVGFVYLALTVGGWLIERRPWRARAAPADARGLRRDEREVPDARGAPPIMLLTAVGVFVYINLARFLGLPAAGAMTMYSGISPDMSNHLVMPPLALVDSYAYVSIVRFESSATTLPAREIRGFLDTLGQPPPAPQVNLNFLRYHVDRVCASDPAGVVQVTLRTPSGETRHLPNACVGRAMRWYVPMPVAHACHPTCWDPLHRWVRGELPTLPSRPRRARRPRARAGRVVRARSAVGPATRSAPSHRAAGSPRAAAAVGPSDRR